MGRLHSLDGLRAISIVLVLLGHLNGTRGFGAVHFWFGDIAHLGVLVFFVISGFLITTLLATENEQVGRISLKLFYARRALRIFPASFAYLAIVFALACGGLIALHRHDMLHALTYTVNYDADRSWYIGHLWSLSVEEQFYLLWPFAFAISGKRTLIWVAAGMMALGPIARAAAWLFLRGTPYRDLEMFPMVVDSLAAGCLLAIARTWLETSGWYLKLFRPDISIGLLAAVLLANRYMDRTIDSVFGLGLINVLIAVLIHRSVYTWRDPAGRLLNWKPLTFLGVLSYSLYLWQQLFINRNSSAWFSAFPQNLALAICAALVSYFLLEKPLMELRHRLKARRSLPAHGAVTAG